MTPEQIMPFLTAAVAKHRSGNTAEAEKDYREVLVHAPQSATALHNLGLILHQAGKHDEAIPYVEKSLVSESKIALFYRNAGSVYRAAGKNKEAAEALRKAVELGPDDGLSWADFGVSLDKAGFMMESMAVYEKAIRMLTAAVENPAGADQTHTIALNTTTASTHPLLATQRPADGTHVMELSRAHYNLGSVLGRLKKPDEALVQYERSIAFTPAFGEPHRNRAAILFDRGRLPEAWLDYEYRWNCADYPGKYPPFPQPTWNRENLAGKTILLWWEQGFGDTIQFCRYAKVLRDMGARVVVICQKELKRLLKTLDGPFDLALNGEKRIDFDVHVSLMGLPFQLQVSPENMYAPRSYLSADPEDVETWRQRLANDAPGNRVGIVWAGAAAHKSDHLRSIPLSQWLPILITSEVRFYSLQLGDQTRQLADLPAALAVNDHTSHLTDFADTAALVHHLDLIITVDTAVAHLAGAMGKDVWVFQAQEPDFRWMSDTDNPSRWYPTMRHFRQKVAGEWKPVIEAVAAELRGRMNRR